jgi:hypothetical protein
VQETGAEPVPVAHTGQLALHPRSFVNCALTPFFGGL